MSAVRIVVAPKLSPYHGSGFALPFQSENPGGADVLDHAAVPASALPPQLLMGGAPPVDATGASAGSHAPTVDEAVSHGSPVTPTGGAAGSHLHNRATLNDVSR